MRRKVGRFLRYHGKFARYRFAGEAALAAQIARRLNSRDDLSHIAIRPADLAHARRDVIIAYLGRSYDRCAALVEPQIDSVGELDLYLYLESLLHQWKFAEIIKLAPRLRERLSRRVFAVRTEQIVRRAFLRSGRLIEAAAGLDNAHLDTMDLGELMLRADIWDALGRINKASEAYRHALRRQSDNPTVNTRYGFHLLKRNDILDGLAHWGVGERGYGAFPLCRNRPLWTGEDLDSRTLLVIFQHGLGDMVQFARFLAPLQARWPGARVVGRVPKVLTGLLAESFPGMTFAGADSDEPDWDYYISAMQLPVALEVRSLEPSTGYITLRESGGSPPRHSERLRVGVCWRGHPREYEMVRSVPLRSFATLFDEDGVEYFTLLNNLQAEETQLLKSCTNVSVPSIADFRDLGAAIAGCDLVVSVDTAVTHVAAAAGKPVLLLSRPDSCWRWGYAGSGSPWYPTVEIIRHPVDMDWDHVLSQARQRIRRWCDDYRAADAASRPRPAREAPRMRAAGA